MILQFGGLGQRVQVPLVIKAWYSKSMATFHSGILEAWEKVIGSGGRSVAWKALRG